MFFFSNYKMYIKPRCTMKTLIPVQKEHLWKSNCKNSRILFIYVYSPFWMRV